MFQMVLSPSSSHPSCITFVQFASPEPQTGNIEMRLVHDKLGELNNLMITLKLPFVLSFKTKEFPSF